MLSSESVSRGENDTESWDPWRSGGRSRR